MAQDVAAAAGVGVAQGVRRPPPPAAGVAAAPPALAEAEVAVGVGPRPPGGLLPAAGGDVGVGALAGVVEGFAALVGAHPPGAGVLALLGATAVPLHAATVGAGPPLGARRAPQAEA